MRARSFIAAAIIVTLTCGNVSSHTPHPAEGSAGDGDTTVWRVDNRCGLNCLYVLMRFSGYKVNYNDMQVELLSSGLPASLLNIQDAAARRGLALEIGRTTPMGLQSIPRPFIAHLEDTGIQGDWQGHFVVITNADAKGVTYLDGTTAETIKSSWPDFQRQWSSYIIFRSDGSWSNWRFQLAATSLILFCVIVCAFAVRHAKMRAGRHNSTPCTA